MKISQTADLQFLLTFDDSEEYERFFEEAERKGYFTLGLEMIPEKAEFRAVAAGSPRSRKIRPVALKGDQVWIKEPAEDFPELEAEIEAPDVSTVSGEAGVPEEEVESRSPGGAGEPETSGSTWQERQPEAQVGESLFDQIRKLPMHERVNLALRADFNERRILIQENNPKINEFLLRNVRITDQEIAWIARNPGAPMQTILAIANNSAWMNSDVIRSAILTNPRTPAHMVMQMIPSLNAGDLTRMHQARYLREDVRQTVEREMKKRGMKVRRDTRTFE